MIVVADTSVLINLCRIGRADLLRQLFREVVIPAEVAREFASLASRLPRFGGLSLPNWVRQKSPAMFPPAVLALTDLDPGETAALALAIEIHADAILLDERAGHEAALRLGLRVIGLLGLLLQAKAAGFISEVGPELETLRTQAGFWISETVRAQVLRLAGENSAEG